MATTSYGSPYVSGSDLVAAWPAASLTVANAIDAAGYYIGRGINAQTASYVGVLTDAGKTVTMTVATSNTFTVPLNATVAYPTGTRINILNLGAGACTVTATGGVTISGTITALATNDSASVIKTATNTWSYLAAPTPGLSFITSGTAAAAASLSINSCFSTLYSNYLITAQLTGSTTLDLDLRLRVGGVDTAGTSYFWDRLKARAGTAVLDTGASTSVIRTMPITTATYGLDMSIWGPNLVTATSAAGRCYGGDATNFSSVTFAGFLNNSTQYDGLSLICSAGNITGTVRVYGYRNS